VCYLAKPSSSDWVDLTVSHKGELHKLHEVIQEQQQDTKSGMEIGSYA